MITAYEDELRRSDPARQYLVLALLAIAAMLLIVWQFSPRYVVWAGLRFPGPVGYPETHRAYFTLLQLADPFIDIDNVSNKVIEWRLLFPVVFSTFNLPPALFLAMPWIGCALVLWYAAVMLWQRTGDLVLTGSAIVLLGSTSWFFTSTGWLAYFDSWYILGGLAIAFSRSRSVVLAAALLTPWVDERVLFMLPVCIAARLVVHWIDSARVLPDRRQWQLIGAAVAPLTAYALVRLVAALWFDQGSQDYVSDFQARDYPAVPLALGTWMGLRLAWAPILAVPLLLARRCGQLAIIAGLSIVAGLLTALVLAGDVSRSMSMLLPVSLVGILLLHRYRSSSIARPILLGFAAGNLLLPATHVVTTFTIPIFPARYEVFHQLIHPPPQLDPTYHLSEAMLAFERGDFQAMMVSLNVATILTRSPDLLANAIVMLGQRMQQRGRPGDAAELFRMALSTGTSRWQGRAQADRLLRDTVPPVPESDAHH
jgi:hypothetical protein